MAAQSSGRGSWFRRTVWILGPKGQTRRRTSPIVDQPSPAASSTVDRESLPARWIWWTRTSPKHAAPTRSRANPTTSSSSSSFASSTAAAPAPTGSGERETRVTQPPSSTSTCTRDGPAGTRRTSIPRGCSVTAASSVLASSVLDACSEGEAPFEPSALLAGDAAASPSARAAGDIRPVPRARTVRPSGLATTWSRAEAASRRARPMSSASATTPADWSGARVGCDSPSIGTVSF